MKPGGLKKGLATGNPALYCVEEDGDPPAGLASKTSLGDEGGQGDAVSAQPRDQVKYDLT